MRRQRRRLVCEPKAAETGALETTTAHWHISISLSFSVNSVKHVTPHTLVLAIGSWSRIACTAVYSSGSTLHHITAALRVSRDTRAHLNTLKPCVRVVLYMCTHGVWRAPWVAGGAAGAGETSVRLAECE